MDSLEVGERFGAVLQQHDCPVEADATLEQAEFVDHVLPRPQFTRRLLVLAGHDEYGE
jgi:hypothetical protein